MFVKNIDPQKMPVRILPDGRMTRKDAAAYLGFAPKTLATWLCEGRGPRSTKVGGRCFYHQKDLDDFIANGDNAKRSLAGLSSKPSKNGEN